MYFLFLNAKNVSYMETQNSSSHGEVTNLLDSILPGGFAGGVVICLAAENKAWVTAQNTWKPLLGDLLQKWKATDARQYDWTSQNAPANFPVAVHPLVRLDVGAKSPQIHARQIVTPGAIGCAASHMLVWDAFFKGEIGVPGKEWLLVLESDAGPTTELIPFLVKLSNRLPEQNASLLSAGMIRLGWIMTRGETAPTPHPDFDVSVLAHGQCNCWGLQAVLIRKSAIPKYLEVMTPICGHIDTLAATLGAAGMVPPTWIVQSNFVKQDLVRLMFSSTIRPTMMDLRAVLPATAVGSNAVVILPWVMLIVFIILFGVFADLYVKSSRGRK